MVMCLLPFLFCSEAWGLQLPPPPLRVLLAMESAAAAHCNTKTAGSPSSPLMKLTSMHTAMLSVKIVKQLQGWSR